MAIEFFPLLFFRSNLNNGPLLLWLALFWSNYEQFRSYRERNHLLGIDMSYKFCNWNKIVTDLSYIFWQQMFEFESVDHWYKISIRSSKKNWSSGFATYLNNNDQEQITLIMVCKNSTKDFWHDSAALKLAAGCFIFIAYLILPFFEAVRFMRRKSEAKKRLPIIYGTFQRNIITYKQNVILASLLTLIPVSLPVLQHVTNEFDINIKIYLLNIHLAFMIFFALVFQFTY